MNTVDGHYPSMLLLRRSARILVDAHSIVKPPTATFVSYTCGTKINDRYRNGSPEKIFLYTAMVALIGETPRPFCIAHPPLTRKSRPHSKTCALFFSPLPFHIFCRPNIGLGPRLPHALPKRGSTIFEQQQWEVFRDRNNASGRLSRI